MAIARVEILAGLSDVEKRAVLNAVRSAVVEALQVPVGDPTVQLVEFAGDDVSLPSHATIRYTIVNVTMFLGRSLDTKRRLYQTIVANLGQCGAAATDVLIVLHEITMENWGVEGGRPANEVDVGFQVDV